MICLAIGLALASCATSQVAPTHGEALTLSIQNLVCSDCGHDLEQRALTVAGVASATFDAKSIELHLQVAPGTQPQPIIEVLQREPVDGKAITASVGAGSGAYAPFTKPEPGWDEQQLSVHGEDVPKLSAALAKGKVTVVDFYADWCGPCHEMDAHLHARLGTDSKLAYRRINIVDWDSAVAKHYLSSAKELPYFIVFDGQGQELARISGAKPEQLDAAIQQGEKP